MTETFSFKMCEHLVLWISYTMKAVKLTFMPNTTDFIALVAVCVSDGSPRVKGEEDSPQSRKTKLHSQHGFRPKVSRSAWL